MALIDRLTKGKQDPDDEMPPRDNSRDDDRTGQGLPSKKLPAMALIVIASLAVYVAFSGNPNQKAREKASQSPEAGVPQNIAQKRPSYSELRNILNDIRGHAGNLQSRVSGNNADNNQSGSDNGPDIGGKLKGLIPNADEIKRQKALKGNVAASPIIVLRSSGRNNSNGQSNSSQGMYAQQQQPMPSGSMVSGGGDSAGAGANGNIGKILSALQKHASHGAGNSAFLNKVSKMAGNSYGPTAKVLPALKGAELFPGVVFPATTITPINTQLPGTIVAQVTNTVYGRNGRIAVPAGSRLVGKYNTSITNGQTRVLAAFQRVIFPDGREIVLSNSQATGVQGASGIKANVNSHFFKMLGASLLVAFLDQGVSAAGPTQTVTSPTGTSVSSAAQTGAQVFGQTVQNVLSPYTNMRPTAVVPAGTAINVLVNKTIVMPESSQ